MKRWTLFLGVFFLISVVMLGLPSMILAGGKQGGTLTVVHNSPIPQLNNAIRSGTTTGYPATKIFASPLRLNMNYEFEPYLAESWEFSEDQKSLTLKLRDATFHDGTPITSKDVAFSIMTIKENHPFKTYFYLPEYFALTLCFPSYISSYLPAT